MQGLCTDGSQQDGEDGKQYAEYGASFGGGGHALNVGAPLKGSVQPNNRAELTAAIEVLSCGLTAGDKRSHAMGRRMAKDRSENEKRTTNQKRGPVVATV